VTLVAANWTPRSRSGLAITTTSVQSGTSPAVRQASRPVAGTDTVRGRYGRSPSVKDAFWPDGLSKPASLVTVNWPAMTPTGYARQQFSATSRKNCCRRSMWASQPYWQTCSSEAFGMKRWLCAGRIRADARINRTRAVTTGRRATRLSWPAAESRAATFSARRIASPHTQRRGPFSGRLGSHGIPRLGIDPRTEIRDRSSAADASEGDRCMNYSEGLFITQPTNAAAGAAQFPGPRQRQSVDHRVWVPSRPSPGAASVSCHLSPAPCRSFARTAPPGRDVTFDQVPLS